MALGTGALGSPASPWSRLGPAPLRKSGWRPYLDFGRVEMKCGSAPDSTLAFTRKPDSFGTVKVISFALGFGLLLLFQAAAQAQVISTKEFNDLKSKADKGDPDAEYRVGFYYTVGVDGPKNSKVVPQSLSKALIYFRMAADKDNAEAAYKVGFLYEKAERNLNSKDVRRNLAEARRYYTKAAEKGLADAQFALAELLKTIKEESLKVDRDVLNALDNERGKWLQEAALQGLAAAQRELGFCFSNGYGFEKDFIQAYVWTKLAAQQGDRLAVERLELIEPGPGKTRTLTVGEKPKAMQEAERISKEIAEAQKKLARSGR
jgi:TPR repeat protein